jgi:REP element-mobilizing transposase RayT
MPQSLSKVYIHFTFSTKYRERLITNELRPKLHAYIIGVIGKLGASVVEVYANPDHVHILCTLPRVVAISKLMQEVKASSSKWLKSQGISGFRWQDGYGAFSVSYYDLNKTANYIRNQEEHHKKKDFKKEYLNLLEDHNIEFDVNYLWD